MAGGTAVTVTKARYRWLAVDHPDLAPCAIIEGQATESSGAPLLTAILATPDSATQCTSSTAEAESDKFTVVSSSETKGEKGACTDATGRACPSVPPWMMGIRKPKLS